jgi:hypothetical protein
MNLIYDKTYLYNLSNGIDLSSGTIMAILVNDYTPAAGHETIADLDSKEVTDPVELENKTFTVTSSVGKFDADNVDFDLGTFTTDGIVLYQQDGATKEDTDKLICYFGLTSTLVSGAVARIIWDSEGIITSQIK